MQRNSGRTVIAVSALLFGICALFSAVLFLSFVFWSDGIGTKLFRLSFSESRFPLTITIFGRTMDMTDGKHHTLSARIALYTADGDSVGTLERSWAGREIDLDCIMIGTGSSWMVFPFIAYTDETTRGHGVDLIRYYDVNNFPALYESRRLRPEERKTLAQLFSLVKTERWLPGFFGSLRHETVSIRSFTAGVEYSLFVTGDGHLLLRSN